MLFRMINGFTHKFVAPKKWDEEKQGRCLDLYVRVGNGDPLVFESAWEPTTEELEALIRGGSVVLRLVGAQLPVALYVEEPVQGENFNEQSVCS